MTLDADLLIERRRLKRRLTFWRLGALLGICALILLALFRDEELKATAAGGSHIARISIDGMILENKAQQELLEKLAAAKQAKAIIIHISSPGGTTSGGEALYEGLRRIAEKKPVAAVFGTTATSAAYLAGIAADHIVARGNTITGSVGVIFQWAEVTDLLKILGVKMEEIRSGPLKANPSPFRPQDEEGRRVSQELVTDSQKWFVGLVAARRKIEAGAMEELKTGRIYTGRQALQIGLIDQIGDEKAAIAWLQEQRGIDKSLRVREWKPEKKDSYSHLLGLAAALSKLFDLGDGSVLRLLTENGWLASNGLDGLISLWHPQKPNYNNNID